MFRALMKMMYRIFGWKVVGQKPDLPKYIIIVAPHTSNIDFFVGVGARSIARIKSSYLAKKELFKIPLVGWYLKAVGGVAVDRSKNTNLVDQVVDIFNSKEEFTITITPEGTRSYVEKWKTGFWHIAKNANVPIVMVAFDYGKKTVFIEEPLYTGESKEQDIETMMEYYRGVKGKRPELGVK